jgi:hypothetical protein
MAGERSNEVSVHPQVTALQAEWTLGLSFCQEQPRKLKILGKETLRKSILQAAITISL